MEEPLIINYYNELPSYAIVINNLNEEYDILNDQYQELLNKHKPIILESNNNNKFIYTIDRKVIIFISFLAFVEITIMLILI